MGDHRKQQLKDLGTDALVEALLELANRQALDILKQTAEHLRSYKANRARLTLQEYLRLTPRNGRYSPAQLQERHQFIDNFWPSGRKPAEEVLITPKPTSLFKRILQIATDKDSLILDSFASSQAPQIMQC
jgi:hypothetical protein